MCCFSSFFFFSEVTCSTVVKQLEEVEGHKICWWWVFSRSWNHQLIRWNTLQCLMRSICRLVYITIIQLGEKDIVHVERVLLVVEMFLVSTFYPCAFHRWIREYHLMRRTDGTCSDIGTPDGVNGIPRCFLEMNWFVSLFERHMKRDCFFLVLGLEMLQTHMSHRFSLRSRRGQPKLRCILYIVYRFFRTDAGVKRSKLIIWQRQVQILIIVNYNQVKFKFSHPWSLRSFRWVSRSKSWGINFSGWRWLVAAPSPQVHLHHRTSTS